MQASVTVPFKGAADGEIYPREFKIGDKIEGDLARAMVEAGYAKSLGGAPENKLIDKVKKKTGSRAGKQSSSPRRGRPKAVTT